VLEPTYMNGKGVAQIGPVPQENTRIVVPHCNASLSCTTSLNGGSNWSFAVSGKRKGPGTFDNSMS
jgi:hypothetical protein